VIEEKENAKGVLVQRDVVPLVDDDISVFLAVEIIEENKKKIEETSHKLLTQIYNLSNPLLTNMHIYY
jgi:predicted enzyme related to lactoylglutathione lyase